MGGVFLQDQKDIDYVWAAYWGIDAELEDYAKEQALSVHEHRAGYELQDPIATEANGFPGIRYDLLAKAGATERLLPKSILFLDTVGGFVILNGYTSKPDVNIEDIHAGAIRAARIMDAVK